MDKATTVGYWTKWKSESQSDRVLCANTIEDGACMLELGRQWYCMSMYDFKTYVWSYVGFCPQGELPGSDVDECPL